MLHQPHRTRAACLPLLLAISLLFPFRAQAAGTVRSTFTTYSTSTGHRETAYSLKGFAVDQRISPAGVLMSQTPVGTFAPEANPPNGIVSPIPTRYAAGPVAVGGVWHQTENDGSGSGDMVAAYRVRAFGSWHGRPTVSLAIAIDQPFRTNGPLPLMGTYGGHASETVVVADGALVAPSHATFGASGTVDGTLNGKKTRDTVVISSTQDVTPGP